MPGGVLITDIAKVRENYRTYAARAGKAEIAAVVKANAYGMGAEAIITALQADDCPAYYCFSLEKSLRARAIARHKPLAYFSGPFTIEDCRKSSAENIMPVLNTYAQIALWKRHCIDVGRGLPFIVHIDTGMRRFGFSAEFTAELRQKLESDGMAPYLYGVISHLACADTPENAVNHAQLASAQEVKRIFPDVPLSLANSSGAFLSKEYLFDQARIGIGLYGVSPFPAGGNNPLAPAVRFDSFLCQVRRLDKAASVGYGAETIAPAGTVLGCLPVGYADGLRRTLANNPDAYCAIGGTPCPYVGRISMDLTVIDVSRVPEALRHEGASVEIFGGDIPVERFAEWCGTIPYEIFTGIGVRVKRRYLNMPERG